MKQENNKCWTWIRCIICLVIILEGCGKPDSKTTSSVSSTDNKQSLLGKNTKSVSFSFAKEKLDNEIKMNFPQIQDFIYPNADIVNQDKNLTDKGLYQTKEENGTQSEVRSAMVVLETSDTIKKTLEYYRKNFPEEHFKIYQRNGKIKTVSFIHVSEFDRKTYERLEVKLNINTPYMSFQQEVVNKQIAVIQKQIMQYKNILHLQNMRRNVPKNQDTRSLFIERKIKELSIQAAALKNKTTLLTLNIQYLSYSPKTDSFSDTK